MTHILITDLREIRYMAYVPEEPNPDYAIHVDMSVYSSYQSALEKAKRDSIEFDREEDCKKIIMAIFYSMAEQDNISPGIYQVPVEVEVVEKCGADGEDCCALCHECPSDAVKVARLKSPEPKPESQEELVFEDLKEPTGSFILRQTDIHGMQTHNGTYFHYSQVCVLLSRYAKELQGKEVNQ